MELLLNEIERNELRTISEVFIDGKPFGFCLEDTVRPDGEKVHGKTAIPAGRYKIELTMSARFKRILPILLDVPNFVGVRIHRGNTELDTEGCLLIGLERNETQVLKTMLAERWLVTKMAEVINAGEDVHITINRKEQQVWS
jgi:hypothetical protein